MDYFIAHLVGDYLLQNDWMAQGKKGRLLPPIQSYDNIDDKQAYLEERSEWFLGTLICLAHVSLYTASVALFTGWPIWALMIVALTHFLQDRTNIISWWMHLKWKDQSNFAKPPMAPWSVIIVDNVWHLVILYLVAQIV